MSTIARMVVAFDGDNSALKRTFRDSARDVKHFADAVVVSSGMMKRALEMHGGDLTKAQRFLDTQRRMIVASHLRIDRELASQIAQADPFIAGMQQRGEKMGRAMAAGFGQGMAIGNMQRAMTGAGAAGGGFFAAAGGGSRAQTAGIAALFTFANLGDAFAAGETKLTRFSAGLSSIMKAGAGVAAFFGPGGLITAGVLATTSLVIDFFAKTRDEATRTAKALEERMTALINSRDTMAQMLRVQELELGSPAAGSSGRVAGAFGGGIADLQAQIAEQEERLKSYNLFVVNRAKKALTDLKAKLAPLIEERRRITAALLNPTTVPEIRGASPITVAASAPGFETAELQRTAQKILALYRTITESGRPAAAEASKLVAHYFALGKALDSIKNPFDDQALAIKNLRAEIEKTLPLLAKGPGLVPRFSPLTPGNRPAIPGPTSVPKIDTTPNFNILQRTLGLSVGNMLQGLGGTIGKTFEAVFVDSFGPVALLFRALEPALLLLVPLIEKLVAPLAALLQVVAVGLEPVMRLLFPVIRALAVVFAVLYEVVARVTAGLAQAIGGLIVGIGKLINKLPGSLGNPLIRFGQSLLNFANETRASADEMRDARKRLEDMQFGDTADDITGLGDAARQTAAELLNVPQGFRVALERFLATEPVVRRSAPPTTGGSGTGTGTGTNPGPFGTAAIVFEGPVTINTDAKSPEEFFRQVAGVAQAEAYRKFGTTARAADMLAFRR